MGISNHLDEAKVDFEILGNNYKAGNVLKEMQIIDQL